MQTKVTIQVSNRLHIGMFSYIDMTEIKDDPSLFIGKPVIDDKTGKKLGTVVDAQAVPGHVGHDAIEFTLDVEKPIDIFGDMAKPLSIGTRKK